MTSSGGIVRLYRWLTGEWRTPRWLLLIIWTGVALNAVAGLFTLVEALS